MNKKGLLLIFSTAIISGVSIFINKFGVAVINSDIFAFLKNLVVALMLTGIILSFKNLKLFKSFDWKKWLMLVTIGLIGGSVPFLLFFKGLSLTSASQGSFIHKTMFIFVALLAAIFLKEKINKYFLYGSATILLGNLLILKNFSFIPNPGDLYILVAVILWAIENTISKVVLKNTKAEIVAWARMFFGAGFIFIYLLFIGQASSVLQINLKQIGWVLITAVFLFGYVITWYKGIARIPISIATSILLLGAPVTTFLTILNTGKINSGDIYSGILVLIGVIIIAVFGYEKAEQKERRVIWS